MLHAFLRLEQARQFFNLAGLALYRDNLQAVVVIDVDVLARDDERLEIVLDVHELVDKLALVMIVAHGDGARHLVAAQPLLFDKVFADEVADGLGAVLVVEALNMTVELVDKTLFERDAESVEVAHWWVPVDRLMG